MKEFLKIFLTLYGLFLLSFANIKVSREIPRTSYNVLEQMKTARAYGKFPLYTVEMNDLAKYPTPLKKIKIAVFDTGVDFSHPLLREFASPNQSLDSLNDKVGHGTHVAGIIVQNLLQSFGRQASQFFEIRSFNYYNKKKDYDLKFPFSQGVAPPYFEALREAIDWEPDFFNISTEGESPDVEEELLILQAIFMKNIVVTAAAGNNGREETRYPCAYLGVICVGSNKDYQGHQYSGSNYGNHVQVFAKGFEVASTLPVLGSEEGSWSGTMTGTSQATPQVTALFAIEKISPFAGKSIRSVMSFKKNALLYNTRNPAGESH